MRIAVVGCGSLGLLWGTRLAELPYDCTLLTRTNEQKKSLLEQGVLFHTLKQVKKVIDVQVETTKLIPIGPPYDVVWVTVKQIHLISLLPYIETITHPDSQILFWQNGLGHEQLIACLQNRPWTYAAITTEGARKVGFREVHHTGIGTSWLGSFPKTKQQPHPTLLQLIDEISQKYSLPISVTEDVLKKIWQKLMINSVINPLTAIYEIKNGTLLNPKWKPYMYSILNEAIQVTKKMGMTFCRQEIMEQVYEVCLQTAANESSMLQDLKRGLKTEIDYINGAIVNWGRKNTVDTPVNQRLVEKIHLKEGRC
jgi:2-dehydropantoate 2-reductase